MNAQAHGIPIGAAIHDGLGDSRALRPRERCLLPCGDNVRIFPWVGTKRPKPLLLALLARQMRGTAAWHAIEVLEASVEGVPRHLAAIARRSRARRDATGKSLGAAPARRILGVFGVLAGSLAIGTSQPVHFRHCGCDRRFVPLSEP